jgi:hypothetical protein
MSKHWCVIGRLLAVGSTALGLVACATGANTGGVGGGGGESAQGAGGATTVGSTSGGVIVGSTSTSAGTGAATTSSSSTGGGETCDLFAAESCSDCLESKCCAELLDCKNDAACWSCLTEAGATGCGSSAAFSKLGTCAVGQCGPVLVPDPAMETGPHIESNPCHFAPPGWSCDPALYDQGYKTPNGPIVCNCSCGGYADPDCNVTKVNDCGANMVCGGPSCGCLPEGAGCQ